MQKWSAASSTVSFRLNRVRVKVRVGIKVRLRVKVRVEFQVRVVTRLFEFVT